MNKPPDSGLTIMISIYTLNLKSILWNFLSSILELYIYRSPLVHHFQKILCFEFTDTACWIGGLNKFSAFVKSLKKTIEHNEMDKTLIANGEYRWMYEPTVNCSVVSAICTCKEL